MKFSSQRVVADLTQLNPMISLFILYPHSIYFHLTEFPTQNICAQREHKRDRAMCTVSIIFKNIFKKFIFSLYIRKICSSSQNQHQSSNPIRETYPINIHGSKFITTNKKNNKCLNTGRPCIINFHRSIDQFDQLTRFPVFLFHYDSIFITVHLIHR